MQEDVHIVNRISQGIADLTDLGEGFTQNLLLTVAVIFLIWLIRTLSLRLVYRRTSDPELYYKWRKYLTRLLFFLAILILGHTWFEGFQSLATFFGILSAALVIALKDSVADRHSANISARAKHQLLHAARSYLITYRILTPTVYTDDKDFGIVLTNRYLTNPGTRRGTEQQIWEDVLSEFARYDDISFAYPTIRYYDRGREGNTGWGLPDDTDTAPSHTASSHDTGPRQNPGPW